MRFAFIWLGYNFRVNSARMVFMQRDKLLAKYHEFDRKFNTHKDYSYQYLVNFSQTKDLPIHRWFYFVEGYSPKLVTNIFEYLGITDNSSVVFDPFSGSGTTLATAKSSGMSSTGFEINPFSAFMIKVKTRNYSKREIEEISKFKIPPYKRIKGVYDKYELKIVHNLFDEEKLEKIEILKQEINLIKDQKVRDALYMALLTILPIVSNYRKGGNGLKRKRVIKKNDPYIEFQQKIDEIVSDLNAVVNTGPEPTIINDSCLNISDYKIPKIDISLFSPPYANCFDPFEVYKTELWIGEFVKGYDDLRVKRKMALTSNLNANLKKEFDSTHRSELLEDIIEYLQSQPLWDKRIPKMLDTYFYDMYVLLKDLYKFTKKGGFCVIVVGNSAYSKLAVPTDILLGELGENIGFSVQEIIEARRNETSSQQHAKLDGHLDFLRESLIILKK